MTSIRDHIQLAQSRSLNSQPSPTVMSHLTTMMSTIHSFSLTLPATTDSIKQSMTLHNDYRTTERYHIDCLENDLMEMKEKVRILELH